MATAMNVLKGAIQKVLSTPVTVHIQYTSRTKGRTVDFLRSEDWQEGLPLFMTNRMSPLLTN